MPAVFVLVYVFNLIDRQILSILAQEIISELGRPRVGAAEATKLERARAAGEA